MALVVFDSDKISKKHFEEASDLLKRATAYAARVKREQECPEHDWNVSSAILGGFDIFTCKKCGYTTCN